MSTQEWADYQHQVWCERPQKRQAQQATEEDESAEAEDCCTEDEEQEEVSRDVGGSSSHDDKYIHSIDADLKRKLLAWHNQS